MKEPASTILRLLFLANLLVAASLATTAQQPPGETGQPAKLRITTQPGTAFTAEERAQIIAFASQDKRVAALTQNQQVKALVVASEPGEKETQPGAAPKRIASVIFFNYTSGKAFRTYVDVSNSQVVQVQELAGRPPASAEELETAKRLLLENKDIKPLLDHNEEIEGGFVVDPPPGIPAKDRVVQFQILAENRHKLVRIVTVDLTANRIAASTAPAPSKSQRTPHK
jgi:hypothetical protein